MRASGSRKLTLRRCKPFLLLPDERPLLSGELLELFTHNLQLPVLPFGRRARASLADSLVQASLHRLQLGAERLDIGMFFQERFPHRLFSKELLAQLFEHRATLFDDLLLD